MLSPEGKAFAVNQAEKDTDTRQSVAFGSPRDRAQQTALFVMSGQEDSITGNENLDELKEKIDKDLVVGSKIGVDHRLNFPDNETAEYEKLSGDAFNEGKYLEFLINESDSMAHELGETVGVTYTRQAQQTARIIQKYLTISPNWSKLVEEKPDQYTKVMERFMGSHQGITEAFLAKVIEFSEGKERRDLFVKSLDGQGFDFVEGYKVYVVDEGKGVPQLMVKYKHLVPGASHADFEFEKSVTPGIFTKILEGETV